MGWWGGGGWLVDYVDDDDDDYDDGDGDGDGNNK